MMTIGSLEILRNLFREFVKSETPRMETAFSAPRAFDFVSERIEARIKELPNTIHEHVWNGPRISIGEYVSVGTCGECGIAYLPVQELDRLREALEHSKTPDRDEIKGGPTK
jgi:hypothetical protein